MKRRIQANEYKILCSEANKMVKMENGTVTSNGWIKVDGEHDKGTNFKGVLYKKDGEYALCFVGTDKWNYKDHVANIQMGAGLEIVSPDSVRNAIAQRVHDLSGLYSKDE